MDELKKRYIYPAVFTRVAGEEISVVFPDLGCATCGETEEDALLSARELLGITMWGLEEDGDPIPDPTPVGKVDAGEGMTMLVDVFMPSVRERINNRSVSRTVTLPAWLNAAALEHGFNFSLTLQDALKEKLGIA